VDTTERKCGNPACARVLKPEWGACPYCGWSEEDQVPQTCPGCGRVMESDWNVCPFCKVSLSGEACEEEGESVWSGILEAIKPSEETMAVLRNIGRVIIILVAMAAFYIVVGAALALLSQAVTQKWAFLGFIGVFCTLVALCFLWELFDSWVEPIAVGVALFVAQAVVGYFLADEWALQAAFSVMFVLGAYLARLFFLGSKIQEAHDEGREVRDLRNQAVRGVEAFQRVVGAGGSESPPPAFGGDDEDEFELDLADLDDEEV